MRVKSEELDKKARLLSLYVVMLMTVLIQAIGSYLTFMKMLTPGGNFTISLVFLFELLILSYQLGKKKLKSK